MVHPCPTPVGDGTRFLPLQTVKDENELPRNVDFCPLPSGILVPSEHILRGYPGLRVLVYSSDCNPKVADKSRIVTRRF